MAKPMTIDAVVWVALWATVLLPVLGWLGHRTSATLAHRLLASGLLSLPAVLCLNLWMPHFAGVVLPRSSAAGWTPELSASLADFSWRAAGKFSGEPQQALELGRESGSTALTVLALLTLVWALGAVLFVSRLVARCVRVRSLVRSSRPVADRGSVDLASRCAGRLGLEGGVRLVRHDAVRIPAVAGWLRGVVFVPPSFDALALESQEAVLLHELAHLRRRDALLSLLAEAVACLLWFHPLVWKSARRLRDLQELAADREVLSNGVLPSSYAALLLRTFKAMTPSDHRAAAAVHSILGRSLLERRIRSILQTPKSELSASHVRSLGLATTCLVLSVVVAAVPGALSAAAAGSEPEPDLQVEKLEPEQLDELLRPVFIDTMADAYVAGAAVAVVHRGEVVYSRGFGRREVYGEVPVDPRTSIFRIGSVTKVLTGMALMQLVERGQVDLDADVNRYLDTPKVPDAFGKPVRVRDLLTHTAGFDQIGLGRHARSAEEVLPLGEFLDGNLSRIRPPGEIGVYDTYGITLAGLIVERVSGSGYEEFLQGNLFEPLEMHRSGISVPASLAADRVVGYEFRGRWFPQEWEYMNTAPASTVNSTVADMANLMIMLLDEGRFRGRQVLAPETVCQMLSQQHSNHPDHPGYGLTFWENRSHGVDAWSHGGSMTGFGSLLYLVPQHQLGVFVAYNQESGRLGTRVVSSLVDGLFSGLRPPPTLERVSATDLEQFVGTYANALHHHADPTRGWRRRPFEITATDDGLQFQGQTVHAIGPLSFQRDDGLRLTFHQDDAGEVDYLFVNQTVYERLDTPR